MMKILQGQGSSQVLVELEFGFGVGVVYDDGGFDGEIFATLSEAEAVYNRKVAAQAAYCRQFGAE